MTTFAGRQWHYEFQEIRSAFSEEACSTVSAGLLQRYSKLTKSWSVDLNSEWSCRLYFAAKLIMSATLHVNALKFSEDRNLRVVVPYLRYYAVLSLLRAVCYTLPENEWKDGRLIEISHGKAISDALEHLGRFNKIFADLAGIEIRELKAERELISYRAPSSGDDQITEKNKFFSLCRLLGEVAQFNSELFEISIHKNADPACFHILPDYITKIASVEIDGYYFGDREDAYRLDFLARKNPYPMNIQFYMTQGHVEDFFGAWIPDEESDDLFNPDEMQSIIYDIP